MRREDFIENVTTWDDLIQFAYDAGFESKTENVYSASGVDDYVACVLVDMAREYAWEDLRDALNEVPTDYDEWYIHEGELEFRIADRYDFDDYKDDLLSEADYLEIWDDEEEEESREAEHSCTAYEPEIDAEYKVGQEEISIAELFSLDNFDNEDNKLCSLEV